MHMIGGPLNSAAIVGVTREAAALGTRSCADGRRAAQPRREEASVARCSRRSRFSEHAGVAAGPVASGKRMRKQTVRLTGAQSVIETDSANGVWRLSPLASAESAR